MPWTEFPRYTKRYDIWKNSKAGNPIYGKIFDSIYDGTLRANWQALVTFQQLIVLADADGVVDMTPEAIHGRTGIPIDIINEGIKHLSQPDPNSRTPDEDGRRIRLLDDHRAWGWYLVNHQKYKTLQDADTIRAQNRERKRKQRERHEASRDVTDGHGRSQDSHLGSRHTDTDTDTKQKHSASVDADAVLITKKKRKFTGWRLETFLRFWEAFNFKRGKAEAADSWIDIPDLDDTLVGKIIEAAKIEAKRRPEIESRGGTPKWAQGWLSARRWEDEIYQPSKPKSPEDTRPGMPRGFDDRAYARQAETQLRQQIEKRKTAGTG